MTNAERTDMTAIVYKDESYRIVGACMEVHNEMGCGYLEAVYHECLTYELGDRGIPFATQRRLEFKFNRERSVQSTFPISSVSRRSSLK